MYKIQTLNNISVVGLERFERCSYEVASDMSAPDAIILRSYKMHDMDIPSSVKAIGRAGAGVNNIPVPRMSEAGVPVFNAPGANANAVKELVLTGMLIAARNVCEAYGYVRALEGNDEEVEKQVEAGKKKYAGYELPGRTIGVIGLGAIGVKVANAAHSLGMRVLGYDPSLTVNNAWKLQAGVEQASSVDDLLSRADFITLHVPLIDATRDMINAERLKLVKKSTVLMNFARGGVIDEAAVEVALNEGRLARFVTDFPTNRLRQHDKVIALPHLGASTGEAEDNCAVMVADQLRNYLETGNITNSVNFPEVDLPLLPGVWRLCIVNANVPNMVGQISTALGQHDINIVDLLNKSRGDLAYTLVDTDSVPPADVIESLSGIEGVRRVRLIEPREA